MEVGGTTTGGGRPAGAGRRRPPSLLPPLADTHLQQKFHRLARDPAGQLLLAGQVQGVKPCRPAAHFAGEAVAQ